MFIYKYSHSFMQQYIPNVFSKSGSVLDAWTISMNTPDKYPCPFWRLHYSVEDGVMTKENTINKYII